MVVGEGTGVVVVSLGVDPGVGVVGDGVLVGVGTSGQENVTACVTVSSPRTTVTGSCRLRLRRTCVPAGTPENR